MAGNDHMQERFERLIGAAAPLLDLVLRAGDRISRLAEPVDYEGYPVHEPDAEPGSAPGEGTADPDAL